MKAFIGVSTLSMETSTSAQDSPPTISSPAVSDSYTASPFPQKNQHRQIDTLLPSCYSRLKAVKVRWQEL